MKYKSFDVYELDAGEPALRSCWMCNGSHEHLKNAGFLHYCVWCDRYWIHGRFLDEFDSAEKLDEFLKARLPVVAPNLELGGTMDIIKRLNDREMCIDAIDDAIREIETLRARLAAGGDRCNYELDSTAGQCCSGRDCLDCQAANDSYPRQPDGLPLDMPPDTPPDGDLLAVVTMRKGVPLAVRRATWADIRILIVAAMHGAPGGIAEAEGAG